MLGADPSTREWLQADGQGGFASGTANGIRTRRYHALLLSGRRTADSRSLDRVVLVNGLEAWVTTPAGRFALSSHRYHPGVTHPDGVARLVSFDESPWTRWLYRMDDGTEIVHELLVAHESSAVVLSWRVERARGPVTLTVRPLLSGRDPHGLHRESGAFDFGAVVTGDRVAWHPYPSLPSIVCRTNGRYTHSPAWYRNFLYDEERARGLDDREDLASPGAFEFDLASTEALAVVGASLDGRDDLGATGTAATLAARLRRQTRRREATFQTRLHRAAAAYVVRRAGGGRTIVAGYPWFSDWGRDTFIAIRGLCIATGRLAVARDILVEWAGAVSEGMLPNYFPDAGQAPEYNAVDASLWYIVAVHDFLRRAAGWRGLRARQVARLRDAIVAILDRYVSGTRHGIHADDDGLLAAGEPGVQLTWMDAKIGDWVVTPRIGKPVEVQALWLNALRIGAELAGAARWRVLLVGAEHSFVRQFWNAEGGYLHDVVDVDHEHGTADSTFRPNQILAVGGLPYALLTGERARRVVDAVETRLWTPLGLRSLAPGEPGYASQYGGDMRQRDASYHQGTVWPWLTGPFVDAWVAVRGGTAESRTEARRRFLEPLMAHLDEAGLGHISEIADAEPPHAPRGCPFQAWSVGEVLRLTEGVLAGSGWRIAASEPPEPSDAEAVPLNAITLPATRHPLPAPGTIPEVVSL
jgi:predicted glycogen debranching enzyme